MCPTWPSRTPTGRRRSPRGAGRAALAAGLLLASPAGAGSITGVCPDGSIFIVQHEKAIPCAGAKRVEPNEVPPLRPEYLPRPYTWQVYNEGNDPNNAYNMIDAARQVRALRDGEAPRQESGTGREGAAPHANAYAPTTPHVARPARGPVDLGLTAGELRDLFLIVELSQERAPARFVKQTADGRERVFVSLAHSAAFERRFAEAWGSELGSRRVLLFSAVAREPDDFYANFTFSQGHVVFQPKADDQRQLGVLQGQLGPLARDSVVLGYVVLPDQADLASPMDVYWNDRRIEARFE